MPGSVAEGILQILTSVGVKSIYGVSGDAIFPLLDALARQQNIKYYNAPSENNAASMAYGEAKLTGGLSVCTATSGPGTVKLLNGLAEAYCDRLPILAITGQVETKKMGTNVKQFFHQQSLVERFSSYSQAVVNPDALVPTLLTAIQVAIRENTVAHLSIPKDVFLQPLEITKKYEPPQKNLFVSDSFDDQINHALSIINSLKCPLVVIGVNCKKTAKAIYQFSQQIGAAVIIAQQDRGTVSEDLPLVIGGIGEAFVPNILKSVDGIILFGECSYELEFLPPVPIVQMAECPETIYYKQVAHWILGKPRNIAETLIDKLTAPPPDSTWLGKIRKEKEYLSNLRKQDMALNQIPIHPAKLMSTINETLAPNAIVSIDIGSFVHWFERCFHAKEHTLILSDKWRSMGQALAKASGAKIADPSRQTIAIIGDGGMLMTLEALSFIAMYNIPLVVLIVNNHSYSLERQKMQKEYLIPFGYEVKPPCFTLLAKAWNMQGYQVSDPFMLESTLSESLNSGQTAIIDVLTADVPLPFLK